MRIFVSNWRDKFRLLRHNKLVQNIVLVGGITFAVKIVGFFKETEVASFFGLSLVLDTFFIAVLIPSFVQNVFIGALKSLFIPNYVIEERTSGQLGSFQSVAIISILCLTLLMGLIAFCFVTFFLEVFFPGHDASYYQLIKTQAYIVLPCLFFWGLASFLSVLLEMKNYFLLSRIFRKEKPDIVHTHTPKAGTIGLTAAYFACVPHRLHTIAGLPLMEITGPKRWLLNFVEKITYAFATRIYPNSKELKKIIIRNKFAPVQKLKVIGNGSSNGIDLDYFNPDNISVEEKNELRGKLDINTNEKVIIYIGRLVGDKGINELAEAFFRLNQEMSNLKLLVIGDYEKHLDPLKSRTEDILNNMPNILPLGFQNDVRPYLAISDFLVFPSYREGFPNVVMQAGAMGIPVIATDINGCNEIIIPNINGILIEPKNVMELKNAIIQLIKNNSFNKNICRKLIKDRYNQRSIWNSIRDEYYNLLEL